jgi:hypothetical protein
LAGIVDTVGGTEGHGLDGIVNGDKAAAAKEETVSAAGAGGVIERADDLARSVDA